MPDVMKTMASDGDGCGWGYADVINAAPTRIFSSTRAQKGDADLYLL